MLHLVLTLIAGFLAWNWIEPESFLGAIGFLIVWGLIEQAMYWLIMGIIALIANL